MAKLNVPLRKQITDNTCGSAVLEMISLFYKKPFTQRETHLDKANMMTVDRMIHIANRHGMRAFWGSHEGSDITYLEEWLEKKVPVVVLQRRSNTKQFHGMYHYRVVTGIEGGYVSLNDPYMGKLKWTKKKFLDMWKQYHKTYKQTYIVIHPTHYLKKHD